MLYWITGRSGSGKTTLARILRRMFRRAGKTCIVLDGDNVRKWFPVMFTDKNRVEHLERITRFALLLLEQTDIVIVACISPIRSERDFHQSMFQECIEIYLEGGTMWEGTVYEEPL